MSKDVSNKGTLRDQFAMAALQGLLSGEFKEVPDQKRRATESDYSSIAYAMADAMMEARK